jgi:glycine/D-amino acid oxidase-like deaminating enzyme
MRIAINGVGIAGPTLAFWLTRAGHDVLLVEEAPGLRTGGYVVDFWGLGYDMPNAHLLRAGTSQIGLNQESRVRRKTRCSSANRQRPTWERSRRSALPLALSPR